MKNIIQDISEQVFDRACENAINYGFNSVNIQKLATKYNISFDETRTVCINTTQSIVNDIRELQTRVESRL
jgi:Mor family transcriptional regulator